MATSHVVVSIIAVVALLIVTQFSRLIFNFACSIINRFVSTDSKRRIEDHPRRKSRTTRVGYQESTWPHPDVEFDEPLQ